MRLVKLDPGRLQLMLDLAKAEGHAEGYAAAMDDVHRCVCGDPKHAGKPCDGDGCTCTSYQAAVR